MNRVDLILCMIYN